MNNIDHFFQAITDVIGQIPAQLHEPEFFGNESRYLNECLTTSYVSSIGPFVDKFEKDLSLTTGAKYVVAVVNGTSALHIALLVTGVKPGDEVLVPTLTFVATANAVVYAQATPHFVDSGLTDFGIDPDRLRKYLLENTSMRDGKCINKGIGKIISAIIPMHVFGHPAQLDELLNVASEFNISMIEDAAESLGSFYKNRHTGTLGAVGVLSFNGNKIITTGGGGAILTNDEYLAAKVRHLSTTAKVNHPYKFMHDEIGYNYRMPNINAALGCAQLERLPSFVEEKRRLFDLYRDSFSALDWLQLVREPKDCKSNYWLQTVLLSDGYEVIKEMLLTESRARNISIRPAWTLLHKLKPYQCNPRMDLSQAEILEKKIINIPSSPIHGRLNA